MQVSEDDGALLMDFEDVTFLKKGGQKRVYRATHKEHGAVVVKVGSAGSRRGLAYIEREVASLRGIDSPYFPRNIAFDVLPDGRFRVVEEFIDGAPLADRLNEYRDPQAALDLLEQLVIGLQVLWSRGEVHRDLKPDNILITPSGQPKIIDLGIVRVLGEESLTWTLLPHGPGTPRYSAAEQLTNRKARIDSRTDQFALGLLLAILLTGQHPFEPALAGGDSITENIVRGKWYHAPFQVAPLRYVDPLLRKLLGREPYQRYRSVDDLLSDLHQCRGHFDAA